MTPEVTPQEPNPLPPRSVSSEADDVSAAVRREVPPGRLWTAIVSNWVVPGSGYLWVGEKGRGLILMALLNGMFLLGLGLHGSVVLPEFSPRSPTFNVINVLTFVVQVGAGGPAGVCLAARVSGEADSPENLGAASAESGGVVRFLSGTPSESAYDLAVFHLLLVGALNYFACCALYDRFRACPPGLRPKS